MNRTEAALKRAASDLDQAGAPWALVGGFAVSVRSEPRFTNDIDVAVAVDGDRPAEALEFALGARGYRTVTAAEQDRALRLATIRLVNDALGAMGPVLDLLFGSSGIEREVVEQSERLEVLPGFVVPVARLGHLLALKVLSNEPARPKDAADVAAQLAHAATEELDRARQALKLIRERGFHRQKDLDAEWRSALARSGR